MKRLSTLTALWFLLPFISFCQAPGVQWQKTLGSTAADGSTSIKQAADSGFIIAGYTSANNGNVTGNHGGKDAWVVKLTKTGNIQWQNSLGGSGDDVAVSALPVAGGYIVAGYSNSNNGDVTGNHGDFDFWVVKLDDSGKKVWQKSYGGSGADIVTGILALPNNGGYVIVGSTLSANGDVTGYHGGSVTGDCWVINISVTGVLKWQKALGGSGDESAQGITFNPLGGAMVLLGYTNSNDGDIIGNHGGYDYWVVRMSFNDGTAGTGKCIGGPGDEVLSSAIGVNNSGVILAGWSNSNSGDVSGNHGGYDYWIVKADEYGAIEWQKCYGGTGDDKAMTVQVAADGNYVVAGQTNTNNNGDVSGYHGGEDYWLLKVGNTGIQKWQKCLGGTGDDVCFSICPTIDYGYILSGRSNSADGDITGAHGADDEWVAKLERDPTIIPKVSIYSTTSICAGSRVAVFAEVSYGPADGFTWKKNNVIVSGDSSLYVDSAINNGDVISCTITTGGNKVNSNKLTFTVIPIAKSPAASLIANPGTTICEGTKVQFTAYATDAGNNVLFEFEKNGNLVGNLTSTYTDSTLKTGDAIKVLVTSFVACAIPNTDTSEILIMKVDKPVAPLLTISANKDSIICGNGPVTFKAVLTPSYIWKKNAKVVGNSTDFYKDSTIKTGDIVQGFLTNAQSACNTEVIANILNSNQLSFKINPVPKTPPAINGPSTVTAGQTGIEYSVPNVDSVTFIWTLPSGAVINTGQGTNTITVTWGSVSGNLSVFTTNSCGSSTPRAKSVKISTSFAGSVIKKSVSEAGSVQNGKVKTARKAKN